MLGGIQAQLDGDRAAIDRLCQIVAGTRERDPEPIGIRDRDTADGVDDEASRRGDGLGTGNWTLMAWLELAWSRLPGGAA